ncbi:hypothetical protein DRQ05_00725 [bacterium]|nr:MAG: hypothetical protein DRQ05_00725 [bacterium]
MGMRIKVNRRLTSFMGALFIWLLGHTWRIEWRGIEHLKTARTVSGQTVFALWHGRLFVLSYTHRKRNIQVLASEHEDGDLMGKTIEWLGFGHLKGSTTRGGARALRSLTEVLRRGLDVGLTVDGPRGPRGVVQQGAVEVARMSSSTIIPLSCTAKPRKLFRSWDRFQLPLPFARVIVAYAEPIEVPPDASREEREAIRLKLEECLHDLTQKLDIELGFKGEDIWPHEDS